jgi:hypothetical protein
MPVEKTNLINSASRRERVSSPRRPVAVMIRRIDAMISPASLFGFKIGGRWFGV